MYDTNLARAVLAELRAALHDPHRCFAVEVRGRDHVSEPTVTVTAPWEYLRQDAPEYGEIGAAVERAVGRPVEALAPVPVHWHSGKPRRGRVAFLVHEPELPRQRDGEAPRVRA